MRETRAFREGLEGEEGDHPSLRWYVRQVRSPFKLRELTHLVALSTEENNIELVLCIVRGADEPRLPGYLLTRIRTAQTAYRKFAKTNPSPLMKAQVQDPDVRLVLELQTYLRLASRDRDAAMMREMLANEEFAAAIETVAEPLIALLKRTYRIGNAAQLLSDVQTFMNQLVISELTSLSVCVLVRQATNKVVWP